MSSQDQRIRTVLARMEFLSYGTTQAFDKSGSRNKATGGNRPPGDSRPVHELYRVLYNRSSTDSERENVILEAEREYALLTEAKTPAEPGNITWRRQIANSDEPMERVLRLYDISRATYYRYRRDYRK